MNRTPSLEGRAAILLFCSTAVFLGLCFVYCPSSVAQSSTPQPASSSTAPAALPGPYAGSSTASPYVSPAPDLQRRPTTIENSQPSAHEEYLLGGGDEITVTVVGRPELSGNHVVGPDGRITMPMVGSIDLGDKSRDDAAAAIDDALGKYYSGKVFTTVQVTKYGSNHILVLGAVEHTGVINFDQPPTLLEAITQAGSLVPSAGAAGGNGGGTPKRCIIYRGDTQVMNVNISDMLDGQKALNDIRLRRNDILYIPANQQSTISVLGEVTRPGPVELKPNMSLVALLADSGGLTPQAGDPEIQIVEPSTGRVQKIKFKALLKPQGGSDVTLHDGDIVYVPRSGLAAAGFFFQQIAPLAMLGSVATLATR